MVNTPSGIRTISSLVGAIDEKHPFNIRRYKIRIKYRTQHKDTILRIEFITGCFTLNGRAMNCTGGINGQVCYLGGNHRRKVYFCF
tara:strand:+ start:302 stop:559 length:258 start_codon:yes stop_codon:yes gene_type:complete